VVTLTSADKNLSKQKPQQTKTSADKLTQGTRRQHKGHKKQKKKKKKKL
jgi:hypothetical protein